MAARLEAQAAPGSIVISESVRKLVEGYFALKPLGPARIKGITESLQIYEVTGLGKLRTRLTTGPCIPTPGAALRATTKASPHLSG